MKRESAGGPVTELIHGILPQDGLATASPFGIKERALVDGRRLRLQGSFRYKDAGPTCS